jgi:hypothetical protein
MKRHIACPRRGRQGIKEAARDANETASVSLMLI